MLEKEQLKQMELSDNKEKEANLNNVTLPKELSGDAVKTKESLDINTAIEKTEVAIGKLDKIGQDVTVPKQGEENGSVRKLKNEYAEKWKGRIKTSDEPGLNYYTRNYNNVDKRVLMFGGADEFLNTDKYDNEKADIYYDVSTLTEEKLKDMWKGLAKALGKPEGYIPESESEAAEIRNAVIEMAKTKK